MCTQGFRNLQLGLRAFLVAALLTGNVGQAFAQSPAAPSGGPREGIKVHGHWTIEVRNPDGTLVTRREFENALLPSGAAVIASLLAANVPGNNPDLRVPLAWAVGVGDSSGSSSEPCRRTPAVPIECSMTNSLGVEGASPTEFFPTLTVAVPASGPNAGRLVLQGTATATNPQPSVISTVLTSLSTCAATVLPVSSSCPGRGGAIITQAVLVPGSQNPPVNLVSGQIIQVTVVISFQ